MSRKWSRMVYKNTKQVNRQRNKSGDKKTIESKPDMEAFKGRSWFLPLILSMVSMFFVLTMGEHYEYGGMYWFTVISYFLLAVFLFFVRRPYLKVGKQEIASRRFGGEKLVPAGNIEQITLQPGYIIIEVKGSRFRWVFSRFIHMMDIAATGQRLRKFAADNGVAIQDKST